MEFLKKNLSLQDLPAPSSNKIGWPWTKASQSSSDYSSNNADYPHISIITPSFNQGQFLEETIRSVLLQGYPNLQYIVIDGGSTDNSVEIIEKYAPWIDYWVSEPDQGQSHAINKGAAKATGEILGWLNSDDYYLENALLNLMKLRQHYPNSVGWVGSCNEMTREGKFLQVFPAKVGNKESIGDWGVSAFYQPACLFPRKLFLDVGGLDERLEYVMDVDLWLKLVEFGDFAATDEVIACARTYLEAKTYRDPAMKEAEMIAININRGNSVIARRRFIHYVNSMPYQLLLKSLLNRAISKILRSFKVVL
jgi:glycosyltransferase involved in cell wall biosynthesis